MKTSFVFQRPICMTVSGKIPLFTARVAPVGRNDFAENPLSDNPAKVITSSKMFATVLLEIALNGAFKDRNTGFVSDGLTDLVLCI